VKNLRMWLRLGVVLTVLFVAIGTTWQGLHVISKHADYLDKVYACTPHFPDCEGNKLQALADFEWSSVFFYAFLAMLIWAALGWMVAAVAYFASKWVIAARGQ
jgi:hypothetical protein